MDFPVSPALDHQHSVLLRLNSDWPGLVGATNHSDFPASPHLSELKTSCLLGNSFNRKDQTRASSLHQGRREALQKENKTVMAAFSILAILTAYAAAGPVPTTEYNHEPQVSTKPFRHTAPSVTCQTEYVVLWSTKYEEREEQVCQTLVQNLCRPTTRQECHTKQTEVCIIISSPMPYTSTSYFRPIIP